MASLRCLIQGVPFSTNYEAYDRARKKNCQKPKQSSEQESDMTQMLELSGREFKITTNNILKALMDSKQHAKPHG